MKIGAISAHLYQSPFLSNSYPSEKISPSPGKNDYVTLSEEGKRRQVQDASKPSSLIGALDDFMGGAGKDGVITLDEIQAFGEEKFAIADAILDEAIERLGIPSGSSITIRTDEKGAVRVDSDLSDQDNARLEAALNEDPDFQQAFTVASSSRSMLDAAKQHMEFARAYAQDPVAAVARYGIGTGPSGEYVMQYAQGQASLVFQGSVSLRG